MQLEQKKAQEVERRERVVVQEINTFTRFVQTIDHILIENLTTLCNDCMTEALTNVASELSSIFEIVVSFSDDGKVVFTQCLIRFWIMSETILKGC